MQNSKRILIILNDLKNGGVERVLSILANHYCEMGHDVIVLAISSNEVSYPLSERVHYEYVPLRGAYSTESINQKIRTMKSLFGEIKRVNPDIYIAFEDSIIVRSVPAAWLLRKRIIVSERTDPSVYKNLMKLFRQMCFDMADRVVFQTKDACDYFPKRTQKKGVIIYNPLSDGLPVRKKSINKDIIMACRLRAQKNVALAIDAFKEFYINHCDYRLVIYGEGELEGALKKQVEVLGLNDSVVFAGHTSNIYEIMSEAAMYLSSSNYEGLSNSMLEALAIGVPCICTDCPVGGAKSMINDGQNGILVPVGDAHAIAKAMSRIADDRSFAEMLSSNSVLIREKLSRESILKQWDSLL